MTNDDLITLIDDLRSLPKETEWVEFKFNNDTPDDIGEYISALANSAGLHEQPAGYLVFGIEDRTHAVTGTSFRPRDAKVGNEEIENWLARLLEPRNDFAIHECDYNGSKIVVFKVDPAHHIPVKFKGEGFIRVGTYKKKLKDHPEKERKIWLRKEKEDWSASICEGATLNDLDPAAIARARENYKGKFAGKAAEVDTWDDATFLNKAKLTIQGGITRAAIILLGKDESEHFLSSAIARISWVLKDDHNIEKDYEHFGPPFLLNIDAVYAKIRNLKYRYLLDNTLFPTEVTKYEPYVIREALNNCIAHQDYELRGRITVVENPDDILFANLGSFLPESVEKVIEQDSPQEYYRNAFLAQAMVNLNLIDTQGGGIKKMFSLQMNRYFPLPDYDLSDLQKVKVRITGKVIDEKYTRLLINKTDLDLKTVILLDRIQKHEAISKEDASQLKKAKLTEGRFPNLYVSAPIADVTGKRAEYIRNRSFDDDHYKKLIVAYLKKYASASRQDIDGLLLNKLSDALSDQQKKNKISNLLAQMSRKDKTIKNKGSAKKPKWVLT
ncbi:MAG: putative DNA binding domain-containing protein [Nitrospirota bacterium]|nr:putative DNA binding domain-containing protein [Nitrospirota bacterium]